MGRTALFQALDRLDTDIRNVIDGRLDEYLKEGS